MTKILILEYLFIYSIITGKFVYTLETMKKHIIVEFFGQRFPVKPIKFKPFWEYFLSSLGVATVRGTAQEASRNAGMFRKMRFGFNGMLYEKIQRSKNQFKKNSSVDMNHFRRGEPVEAGG